MMETEDSTDNSTNISEQARLSAKSSPLDYKQIVNEHNSTTVSGTKESIDSYCSMYKHLTREQVQNIIYFDIVYAKVSAL